MDNENDPFSMPPMPTQGHGGNKHFPQLKYWMERYAAAGAEDQRAVQTYMDCESNEAQSTLRNELRSVSGGNYQSSSLEKVIGKNRSLKHGSFDAWGKLMLQWMASYKG